MEQRTKSEPAGGAAGHRRFPVRIDDDHFEIEGPKVLGQALLDLVGKRSCRYELVEIIKHHGEKVIGSEEEVDLSNPGVEQFVTRVKGLVTVFVTYDTKTNAIEVPHGSVLVAQIKSLAGIPAEGYFLTNLDTNEILDDSGSVSIEGCERFVAQVDSGGSS